MPLYRLGPDDVIGKGSEMDKNVRYLRKMCIVAQVVEV